MEKQKEVEIIESEDNIEIRDQYVFSFNKEQETSVFKGLPVGYRFKPTDEELVLHYLMNKVSNKPIPSSTMQDIDASELYSAHPNKLVSYTNGERDWYFFVHENETYYCKKKKLRIVRDGKGFWKSSGEYPIRDSDGNGFAFKLCFRYFRNGRNHKAKKTHWRMEEYQLQMKEEWVLSRIRRGIDYSGS